MLAAYRASGTCLVCDRCAASLGIPCADPLTCARHAACLCHILTSVTRQTAAEAIDVHETVPSRVVPAGLQRPGLGRAVDRPYWNQLGATGVVPGHGAQPGTGVLRLYPAGRLLIRW